MVAFRWVQPELVDLCVSGVLCHSGSASQWTIPVQALVEGVLAPHSVVHPRSCKLDQREQKGKRSCTLSSCPTALLQSGGCKRQYFDCPWLYSDISSSKSVAFRDESR